MAAEASLDGADDDALLAAHVAGDPHAFGILFARHRDRLWAVAVRTAANPEIAAEGLQEGMIAAFRRADSFRGDARVTTWLHRIVVNACLDRLRAEKVRAAEPLVVEAVDAEPRTGVSGPAPPRDPADLVVAGDTRAQVLAALDSLPPAQRVAVVLVDMEGYPIAEAAEILGCPTGTVKSRCARGRGKLAGLLRPLLLIDDGGPVDPPPAGNPSRHPDVGSVSRRGPPDESASRP